MFPFPKKKTAHRSESTWSVLTGERDGKPIIVRRNDSAGALTGHTDYRFRVGIAVPFNKPSDQGLPSTEEMEELSQIEDALETQLESHQRSIQVLSITTGGMREFVFYTQDPAHAKEVIRSLRAVTFAHEIQGYVAEDPEWEVYKTFSYRSYPPVQ